MVVPSIFDVLSHETLNASLKAVAKSFVEFLPTWYTLNGRQNPRVFQILEKHFDEFYMILQLFIDGYCLSRYDGTLTESFYGIRRTPTNRRRNWKTRSLLICLLMPYFISKLKEYYARVMANEEEDDVYFYSQLHGNMTTWRRLFIRFYPIIRALFLASALAFHVAYTFSLSEVPSPLLYLAGVRYRCASVADANNKAENSKTTTGRSFFGAASSIPGLIGRLFTYGILATQFFERYFSAAGNNNQMPPFKHFGLVGMLAGGGNQGQWQIPPHPREMPSERDLLLGQTPTPLEVGKCPLCHNRLKNDTILSVSGYVFCDPCIRAFLALNGKCPVTGLPATPAQLIKIYHQ